MTDTAPPPEPARHVNRILEQLAGLYLTADEAEQIVDVARSRIGTERTAPLTSVEQTRPTEHEHDGNCHLPGSACPDASN